MAEKKKPKNGTIKESTRDGKRAMVYYNGKWHHFGQSGVEINQSKEQAEKAKSRHEKSLNAKDDRGKAFRIYWNKFWSKAKV